MPVATRSRGPARAGVAATTSLDLGALPPELIDAVLQRATLRSLTRLALTNQPWCELVTAHLLQEESKHWAAPTALFRACANPANGPVPTCSAIHDALDACQRDECIPDALASAVRARIPYREYPISKLVACSGACSDLRALVKHTEETALQLYTAVGLRLSPAVFIEVATKLWERQKEMWAAMLRLRPAGSASWCHVVCGAVASIDRLGLAGWDAHDVLSLWRRQAISGPSCAGPLSLGAVIETTMMPLGDAGGAWGQRIGVTMVNGGLPDICDLEIAEGKILDLVSTGAASPGEQVVFLQALARQQAMHDHADDTEDMFVLHQDSVRFTVAQHLSTLACAAPASVPVVVELVSYLAAEAEQVALNNYSRYDDHDEPADHSPVVLLINDWSEICVEGSRPKASANSPSSTPRQRQIKRRAASSLGQPRPASANWQISSG